MRTERTEQSIVVGERSQESARSPDESRSTVAQWRRHADAFMRGYLRGEHPEALDWEPKTKREVIQHALLNIVHEAAGIMKVKAFADTVRLAFQKYHERVEQQSLLETLESGIEEEPNALEQRYDAMRQRLHKKIEQSPYIAEEEKWKLLAELNVVVANYQESGAAITEEVIQTECEPIIREHVESQLQTKKVLIDLALAVAGFYPKLWPVKIYKIGKAAYKSVKHALRAQQRLNML